MWGDLTLRGTRPARVAFSSERRAEARVGGVLTETTAYEYNEEGNVSRIVRRVPGVATVTATRFEYDRPGHVWRTFGEEWTEPVGVVGDWHRVTYPWGGQEYEVALTNQAMTLAEAQAAADSLQGWLSEIAWGGNNHDFETFNWFVDTFRPTDDQEARYWTGGFDQGGEWPCDGPEPHACWDWAVGGGAWTMVVWMPPRDQSSPCGYDYWPYGCYNPDRCHLGGWLPDQPDDDGLTHCVEDGEQDRMVMVFNAGNQPSVHGLDDVDDTGTYRALITRPVGVAFPTTTTWAREFRCTGGRQRYLTRELDPQTLEPVAGSDVWSDYKGDSIYADYTVSGGMATTTRRYVPGAWETDVAAATTAFFHTDHLGTTRLFSDADGQPLGDTGRVYTAFGVPVTTPASPLTRYGYAGSSGYESLAGLQSPASGLLQVGERSYDPGVGRFLQRDPTGILGGLGVYNYVHN
jgi:RHS repeat-associated protein